MNPVGAQERRVDARGPGEAAGRLPGWLKQELPSAKALQLARRLEEAGLCTVCVEARCPNINRCFARNAATFLILGAECTRSCGFCNLQAVQAPALPDADEPGRIARAADELDLDRVVITSVTRDDLADGGAAHFARVVAAVRALKKRRHVEILIPDFRGNAACLAAVAAEGPDVIAHNLETVRRLYPDVRPQADYDRSLGVLRALKKIAPHIPLKSSLMLGLSETKEEVLAAMRDLRAAGCDILMIGQYLAPSTRHLQVREFLEPAVFARYEEAAYGMGFSRASCAPLVRSSYA
jgi:lipoic acid synthetase